MENGNFEEAFNDFTQAKNLKSTTVAATEGVGIFVFIFFFQGTSIYFLFF